MSLNLSHFVVLIFIIFDYLQKFYDPCMEIIPIRKVELHSIEAQTIQSENISMDSSLRSNDFASLEAEVPEDLYRAMKDFILNNPKWNEYEFMSSALVNFLYQNGCTDRVVLEKYLNDLFKISDP